MICHHSKPRSNSSGTTGSTDIVTYRYHDELIYVPLARDYHHALAHARDAFRELRGLPDTSISLSLTSPGHSQKFVGISASAWPKLIAHLTRYQIIDVQATRVGTTVVPVPDITITFADAEEKDTAESEPAPPPAYPSGDADAHTRQETEKSPRARERVSQSSPSAAPAPTLHRKRSWLIQKLHGQ